MELADLKVTRYEVADAVATITLVRPERLNAWTGRMHTEYRALLARAADDPGVRVIVVTGAGRGFCAGADTRALEGHVERGGYDPGTGPDLARPGYGVRPEFDADFAYHFGIAKPIIAAVNGAGRRGRVRPGLLLRSPLRRRRGQAHHRPRPARAPGRVRPVVAPAPPDRAHPGRRPAALQPGGPGRGGGRHGARQPGRGARRTHGGHLRLRPDPGHRGVAGLVGRHQAPDVPRPPPRRRHLRRRLRRPARGDDDGGRLRRRGGGPGRAPAAPVRRPAGRRRHP